MVSDMTGYSIHSTYHMSYVRVWKRYRLIYKARWSLESTNVSNRSQSMQSRRKAFDVESRTSVKSITLPFVEGLSNQNRSGRQNKEGKCLMEAFFQYENQLIVCFVGRTKNISGEILALIINS
jgi:hypothetical protein